MSHSTVEVSPTRLLVGKIAILVSFCVLVLILLLPLRGLTPAGQAMLGILSMAIILWVTEAMAYPVSALLIALLMTLFLGLIPNPDTGTAIGTSKAILLAMKGFSSPSIIVIFGALIMAAAMQATELDRRIARTILLRVHPSPNAILAGCLLVGAVFSFLIPSSTGRIAVQISILSGVVATLGLDAKSRFTAILVIGAAQVSTIWNVGVMTATGHNVAGLELMAEHSGFTITWAKWLLHAGLWSAFMTVILFLILRRELKGLQFNSGTANLASRYEPLNKTQKRLALYTVLLITSWITEGALHHITVPATMLIMSVCLLLPGIGVFDSWKELEKQLPWGVIVMFGVSISLGQQLVNTGAAAWLADSCFSTLDISSFSIPLLVVVMTAFTIIMHLGFASATSVTVALLPVFLAFTDTLPPSITQNAMGLVLLQLFAVSFGMILPVNTPQNMVAYSTGSFDTKTFARIGLQLTVASLATFALFAATWWKWTGLLT